MQDFKRKIVYLKAGGTSENAQAISTHESPRTTKLYDHTGDEITLWMVDVAIPPIIF